MAGIYIHIPFCVKKCLYCDFVSDCGTKEDMSRYQHALQREILNTPVNEKADTVFFGGGTPSVYPAGYTAALLELFRQKNVLSDNCEITIEVNPGTVDREKLMVYRKAGINRLSIGLQSADDIELKLLGRIHDYDDFIKTYEEARAAGFENINIDLISAIPGQTVVSYENTLRKILDLSPEHISAYSLIVEEGTPLYERQEEYTFPDEEDEREMYYLTKRLLQENGYFRYEISNYAKKGYACRHNLKYWSRENYYGFGTAAASLVNPVRYTNITDRTKYIEADGDIKRIRAEATELSGQEQIEEFMFLGLRKMEGVSVQEFKDKFHMPIEEIYGQVIEKAVDKGLLTRNLSQQTLCLTERGIDVSNVVMAEFLL